MARQRVLKRLDCALLATENRFRKCRRGRERRGVLVYIEVVVEVRHVGPLDAIQIVDVADSLLVPVVPLEDVSVNLGERIARQRLAILALLMDGQLEFCELSLAEYGPFEAVQVAHQQR